MRHDASVVAAQAERAWLDSYFDRYRAALTLAVYDDLVRLRDLVLAVRAREAKLIFAGNGASASIAAHARVDFTKQARVRAIDFNEPNLITAFSNDYGFEHFMARALDAYADAGDVVVLVSVSGASPNVLRAAERARERGLTVVSFTGKDADNPLRGLSDLSFWLDSAAYNIVECVHMMWLCTVVDMVVGSAEYVVN